MFHYERILEYIAKRNIINTQEIWLNAAGCNEESIFASLCFSFLYTSIEQISYGNIKKSYILFQEIL